MYGTSIASESSLTGFVVGLDFSPLHQRVCSGIWDPTMPESDYEFWIPRNFENGKCLFGRKMKYLRRKREASCFNQEMDDKKYYVDTCACIEDDWECDYGYYRRIEGSPCVPIANEFNNNNNNINKLVLRRTVHLIFLSLLRIVNSSTCSLRGIGRYLGITVRVELISLLSKCHALRFRRLIRNRRKLKQPLQLIIQINCTGI